MEFEIKQRMVDNLPQTFAQLSLMTLLDEFLKQGIKSFFGCNMT
jgi:hypothetical protein